MRVVVPIPAPAARGATHTVPATVLQRYARVVRAVPAVVVRQLITVAVPTSRRAPISRNHVGAVTMTTRVVLIVPLRVAAVVRPSRREEVPVRRVALAPAVPVVEAADQAAGDNGVLIFYG